MPRKDKSLFEVFGEAKADYEAAKRTRFKRTRKGVSATGSHADYHYRTWNDYARIMETARDLFRNHALLGQAIRRFVANILRGGGFTLDVKSGDPNLDSKIADRWQRWSETPEQCDRSRELCFQEMERLALQQVVVDGDVFALPTKDGSVQLVEGHRVRTPRNTKRNVVHGILLDQFRVRKEYWVTREEVDPHATVSKVSDMKRYAARSHDPLTDTDERNVLHLFMPDRTSQTRGVTALVPVVDTAGMGDDLMFAQLVKAQMAACITIFREMDKGVNNIPGVGGEGMKQTSETRPDGTTRTIAGYQPGMEMFGHPGEKLHGFSPNIPNQEFFQHANLLLSILAVNLDLPVAVLLLDPSETNFSGWRGAMDQARQRFQVIQQWMIKAFHAPLYRWKVRQWARDDIEIRRAIEAPDNVIDPFRHVWHAQEWPYIEPTQDALGDVIQERNLLISPRRRSARRGMDYDDLTTEIMEDRGTVIRKAHRMAQDLNKELGLSLVWQDIAHWPMPDGVQISLGNNQGQGSNENPSEPPTNGRNGHARALT